MNNNKLTLLLFSSVCIIWGTTWYAMEVAVQTIPPVLATGLRFLIAFPILMLISIALKKPIFFPKGKIKWLPLISIFYFSIPFSLMIMGEMYISSGLASIIFANMPIAVMFTSMLFLNLKLNKNQILGTFISVFSLVAIIAIELELSGEGLIIGSLCLISAVLIHALMYVFVKKTCSDIHVLTYNTLPTGFSSLILITVSLLLEEPNIDAFSSQSLYSVIYLGLFASVGGILAYFMLGQVSSPFIASQCFLIFPLIAISINKVFTTNPISDFSLMLLLPLLLGIMLTKLKVSLKPLRLSTHKA